MADVLRTYDPKQYKPLRSSHRRKSRKRGSGCGLLLMVLLALTAYGYWASRDTYPMARLIPRDQAFRVFAADLLNKRERLAASQFWSAIPPSWGLQRTPDMLREDFGLPVWVINNLVGPLCQLSGNDMEHLDDALFVTRMRRIGCLVEKLHWLKPGIERDHAGGLKLRYIEDEALFYAVRGRILVASPSRDALINALTLREENAFDETSLAQAGKESREEDFHGAFAFAGEGTPTPCGEGAAHVREMLSALSFSVQVTQENARVTCRAAFRPTWHKRLGSLLQGLSPQTLRAPPEGMAGISAHFGKPVAEVWDGLAAAFEAPPDLDYLWAGWKVQVGHDEAMDERAGRFLMGMVGPLGPGLRLSWCGMDLNEMLPMPELAATFDAAPEEIASAFDALPPLPEGIAAWEPCPRYDRAARRAYLPLFGGPSVEPTVVAHGDMLLVSTSRSIADALAGAPTPTAALETPGNLYLRVQPPLCADAIYQTGILLVENDLLEGYDAESFEEAMRPWLERSGLIRDLRVLLAYEDGEVTGDLRMRFAGGGELVDESRSGRGDGPHHSAALKALTAASVPTSSTSK
ncbi:MAG TPA: hypothetical protein ENN80_00255 [Candidatus Hydrogenedentes bacterium]|nr:hypothetical protein [Candidatus Hydrogenedentota bacterium]